MTDNSSLEQHDSAAGRWLPCSHCVTSRFLVPLVAIILLCGLAAPALAQTKVAAEGPAASLHTSDLWTLKKQCGSAEAVKESYELTRRHGFGGTELKAKDLLAFEENRFFIYAVGDVPNVHGSVEQGHPAEEGPRLVRRFIFLKPATFVVDDQVRAPGRQQPIRWLLHSRHAPQIAGRQVRITEPDGQVVCETLLPKKATQRIVPKMDGRKQHLGYLVEVTSQDGSAEVRLLHVLQIGGRGEESRLPRSELVQKDGELELTVSTDERVFRLSLAHGAPGADEIAISNAAGEGLLPGRLLPAGVLPYGPEAERLLERWDSAYRGDRRPGWDTGRPSSNLKKAVEDGTLRPCRAVVLGCGSGTNAVYLAGKGFDVTGIDIAPTALSRAKEKARKAQVEVRWLLADVLAPPQLEPFELIFDRGCYHGVRRQNAAGYVETVRRLSRPGTRILLLAGNANEERDYGPPRVTEEELRGDFSSLFDFEWLRETRFDSRDPEAAGALAWSVLLRRKAGP